MSFFKRLLGGDFDSNRTEADRHFEAGEWGEAKLAYEKALAKGKDVAEASRQPVVARIAECRGRLAAAHMERAEALYAAGEIDAGDEAIESAIEVAPDDESRERYRKRLDSRHADEARAGAEGPEEMSDEDRYELLSANWGDAQLDEYEQYGEGFRAAYLAVHEGAATEPVEAALAIFRKLAGEHPEHRYLHLEIGQALRRLGRKTEALESYRALLAALGDDEEEGLTARLQAHVSIADIAGELADDETAESELREAAELAPDQTVGHLRLAMFLRARGRQWEALSSLEQAARTMSELRPDVRVLREIGLNQAALGRDDEAIEVLEGLVELQARQDELDLDPDAAVALAELHERRGEPRRAADLHRHLARGSDIGLHFHYYAEAARLLQEVGETAKAREHLTKSRELAPTDEPVAPKPRDEAASAPCPLLPVQQDYAQMFEPNFFFMFPRCLELSESVKREHLEMVVRALARRHDALRCRFVRDESAGWRQRIDPPDDSVRLVEAIDLSRVPAVHHDRAIATVIRRMARDHRLAEGRPGRWMLFDLGRDRKRVLVGLFHHLIGDLASMDLVTRALQSGQRQLASGEPIWFPEARSMASYAEALARWGAEGTFQGQVPRWQQELDALSDLAGTIDRAKPQTRLVHAVCSLTSAQTESLVQRATAAGVTVAEVVAAAAARALARWAGTERISFSWFGHGRDVTRDGLDLRRTLGPVFRLFPVTIEGKKDSTPEQWLSAVRPALLDREDRGLGYTTLANYAADEALRSRLRAHPAMQLRVNYLGDQTRRLVVHRADESMVPVVLRMPLQLGHARNLPRGLLNLVVNHGEELRGRVLSTGAATTLPAEFAQLFRESLLEHARS